MELKWSIGKVVEIEFKQSFLDFLTKSLLRGKGHHNPRAARAAAASSDVVKE